MNRKDMLETYGNVELVFSEWYKNTFTLKPLNPYEYPNLKVTFVPDYRDNLSLKEVNTIRELTELDDHISLCIYHPEEVYYSGGNDIPTSQYLEEFRDE